MSQIYLDKLEKEKVIKLTLWVVYYYDKDTDGNTITKSFLINDGGNVNALHTELFYFNQKYLVKRWLYENPY